MQSNKKQKITVRPKLSIKNNHFVQCFIYQNASLFKGDTYVYRGLFNRFGGYYDKSNFGFIVPLDNYEKVSDEIKRMAYGFIIYKKDSEIIQTTSSRSNETAANNTIADPHETVNSLKCMDL